VTRVAVLDPDERREEIARMLAGATITDEARAAAGRLLAEASCGPPLAARDEIEIAGVRLTSPDKVLYPEQGITKRDLANYMVAVGDWMLPHVAKRPITLVRCPTGRQKKCFYQRHAGSGVPKELGEIAVPGFEEPYLFVRDVRGLIALVQMGVLEIHPWGATNDRPGRPDRMIFDLDPGEGLAFADVVAAAREVHQGTGSEQ